MAILRTLENESFILHQHDEKIDKYTAICKNCGHSHVWITGRLSTDVKGIIMLDMVLLCPSCKQKATFRTESDTNPAKETDL